MSEATEPRSPRALETPRDATALGERLHGDGRTTADVAVVIVNANAGELLEQTLTALDKQTVRPRRVIVVDNASTDGSVDGLEELHRGAEVIRLERNVGFAEANNVGVRAAAECEWIALLNPDAFPEPDWLEVLARAAAEHPEYAFFASRLLNARDAAELDGAGDAYHVSGFAWRRNHGERAEGVAVERQEVFSACAAAALYRRSAFVEAGGFDPDYFCYYEDHDLSFRLRLAGHRCLYLPEAVVKHVGSAVTGRESAFTTYHAQRNVVWTFVKDMPPPLVWLYLPEHVLMNVLAVAWYSLRGQARAVLRAKADAVRVLPGVLRARREIQRTRRVGASDVRRVMSRGASGPFAALGRARRAYASPAPRRRTRSD